MRKKTGTKYDTIKIPEGLTKEIDTLVKAEKYTSRTDLIKFAVRLLYREYQKKVSLVKEAKKLNKPLGKLNDSSV